MEEIYTCTLYIPYFTKLAEDLEWHIKHSYSKEMSQQSKVVYTYMTTRVYTLDDNYYVYFALKSTFISDSNRDGYQEFYVPNTSEEYLLGRIMQMTFTAH